MGSNRHSVLVVHSDLSRTRCLGCSIHQLIQDSLCILAGDRGLLVYVRVSNRLFNLTVMTYKYRIRVIVGHGPDKEQDYYFFTKAGAKFYKWCQYVFKNRIAKIHKLY